MRPGHPLVVSLQALAAVLLWAVSSIAEANAPSTATAATSIEFTPAEQAYIAKASAIKMCVDPDWAPFERINAQGQHEGIAADLVQLVAQRVGLRIELLPVKDWDESLAASQGKRCQVMSFLNQSPARDAWLIFTAPIFSDPNVIITREEHDFIGDLKGLKGKSVALPRGTMVEERVRRDFPNLSVVLTASEPESMKLVSERKADMTIRSLIVAAHAIKTEGLFNLKISGQIPEYTNHLRMGVLKDEPVLRSILDKGIQTITPQERQAIANQHIAIRVQQGIDWARVYALLALLALVVLVALYIYRNNRKLQAALTASQETREALRLSEERHRFLADNASDVIWTMDLHGRNTYVSPSVERLRGYTVAEAMQQTIDQALTPASAKIAQAGMARALEAIQAHQKAPDFRAELEQPCKHGGTVWTEVRFSCMYNEAGEFVNFLGVTRDISERKRTELDLQIAAIAFESQDGMIVTDAHKTILPHDVAGRVRAKRIGRDGLGKTPRVLLVLRGDRERAREAGADLLGERMWHGELWSQRKRGEVYPEQITITAVKDGTGQVTHHVAVLRDITERKRLEQEVNQLAFFDTLTQMPNRRLFGDRLGQALKRAQRTSSSVALMFVDLDNARFYMKKSLFSYPWQKDGFKRKYLMGCLRASDTAARVGGDEFLVLLPDIPSGPAALAVAEKICAALAGPCTTPEGIELCISASIGIAIYPEHAGTEHELMRLGDRAMYEAKNAGGNRVQLHDSPHDSPEGEVCSSAV